VDRRRSLAPLMRNIPMCYGADRRLGPVPIHTQCAPLSWRTEIQRLILHDLERFGTINLVGLPSVGSKESAPAWAWNLGRSLKVPVGEPARFSCRFAVGRSH
jgi:hypothetical protein